MSRVVVAPADQGELRRWDQETVRLERSGQLRLRETRPDCQIPNRLHDVLEQYVAGIRVVGAEIRRQRAGGVTASLGGVLQRANEADVAAFLHALNAVNTARLREMTESGAELVLAVNAASEARPAYRVSQGPASAYGSTYIDAATGEQIVNELSLSMPEAADPGTARCVVQKAKVAGTCEAFLGVVSNGLDDCANATATADPKSPADPTNSPREPTIVRTLFWDPNEDQTIGYRVLIGREPSAYTTSVDVGNATAWPILGLPPGSDYVFAVQAYDAAGLSSAPSQEVRVAVASDGRVDAASTAAAETSLSARARVLLSMLPPSAAASVNPTAAAIWRTLVRLIDAPDPSALQMVSPGAAGRLTQAFFGAMIAHRRPDPNNPRSKEDWNSQVRRLAMRVALFLLPADADDELFEWASVTAADDLDGTGELRSAALAAWDKVRGGR